MSSYRLRNWSEYNRALAARGALTLWFDADVLAAWRAAPTGKRGHPLVYSDRAIECLLTIEEVYHQALRQTTGLVHSLFALLGVAERVPSPATLSRRRRTLAVLLPVTVPPGSTFMPCRSAQRVYMRCNMPAQSLLSVPPAPALISI